MSACAAAPRLTLPATNDTLVLPAGQFRLAFPPREAEAAGMVRLAVEHAMPRLARWGAFEAPVTLVIHPDHESLEVAANRSGYDFLRVWARDEQIEIQSPRTWTPSGAAPAQVDEVLLHELTHSLMFQRVGDARTRMHKAIPLWFREGMAYFTAEQGYRALSLEDLARYLHEHPTVDPVAQADRIYREDNAVVYSAAYHAFTFLVRRYGEDAVRDMLQRMRQGAQFPEAFEHAVGIPVDAFLRDFHRYVYLRGFKGGRITRPVTADP
ncbi:peptidase MA family metallohydrolase [Citreicoccus inhibens]|uniref:peptidase MA family metallohydrolase n=1 Tax=Citreicoccus inhibens TaxID=2849499 RepID=UPI001EEF96C8|nr:collagenase [Citreicoccus inhibens]